MDFVSRKHFEAWDLKICLEATAWDAALWILNELNLGIEGLGSKRVIAAAVRSCGY